MKFCVLVTSSDSRKDIFDTCFAHSERIWQDCNWPRYAGFTTPQPDQYGFKMLASWKGYTTEWCLSVAAHVDALPPEIKYILLIVEDVLFIKPIDGKKLDEISTTMAKRKLRYLRLVPLRRSRLGRAKEWLMYYRYQGGTFRHIEKDEPYYSSTEMVLWERGYLLNMLKDEKDAWSFEHSTSPWAHWAVREPIFDQHQIVQKGCWNWDAPKLLRQVGLPPPWPGRPYQGLGARYRGHWQNLNFAMFGWTSFRVKRWLRS